MAEYLVAAIVGAALTVAVGTVVVVHGRVPVKLLRLVRLCVPADRLEIFDAGADVLGVVVEPVHSPFELYAQRRDRIAGLFAEQVAHMTGLYADADIVIAVHPWEHQLVLSMTEIVDGRLYGRFELVQWDRPDVGVIARNDIRYMRRRVPRPPRGSNGTQGV